MTFSRADALATAERSPTAAGARDRDAWLGLFAPDARVEDPVGSQPHLGRVAIGRFFDTFIGPRDVAFLPDVDIVSGSTVVRDGVLQASLGSIVLRVPIYIRYDLHEHGDDLRIAALSAFWELPAMVGEFIRSGVAGLPPSLQLSKLLLTNQGVSGTLGFLRGLRGTGAQGKRRLHEFMAHARAGDEIAVRRLLARGAEITCGDHAPMATAELMSRLANGHPHKVIAAGNSIVAGIDSGARRDVLIADVARKPFGMPFQIGRIRYFSDSG
jgi:hypothetical protein